MRKLMLARLAAASLLLLLLQAVKPGGPAPARAQEPGPDVEEAEVDTSGWLDATELGYLPVQEPEPTTAGEGVPHTELPPAERDAIEAANRLEESLQSQRDEAIAYADGMRRRAELIEQQRIAGTEVMP